MNDQYWSWILTGVGLTGFWFVTSKKWWALYINLFCQVLWFIYAIVTDQFGFIVASLFYTVIFGRGAIKWTKEHFEQQKKNEEAYLAGLDAMVRAGITTRDDLPIKFED